jgi:HEAT repeat protein
MRFVYNLSGPDADRMLVLSLAVSVAGIIAGLTFVLLRRLIRSRYFRRRDAHALFTRTNWDRIVSGEIAPARWSFDPVAREVVEEMALDRLDTASGAELERLRALIRVSGLLDGQMDRVRRCRGWRRRKALLALGRMQLPECVPALSEALEDSRDGVVVDAIRALGRVGNASAGEAIVKRLSRSAVTCPAQALESALTNCYANDPSGLLELVLTANDAMRPAMARVLASVAWPGMQGNIFALASDRLADVRASAARILALARPAGAFSALTKLAGDPEWFVRLRTMVALGDLHDPAAITVLLGGLCDINRLVRLRAASALAGVEGHEQGILHLATLTKDRYALQVLVSEMQRAGTFSRMVEALAIDSQRASAESGLGMAIAGGANRMLLNLMLRHPNASIRENLARILAQASGTAVLSPPESSPTDEAASALPQQARMA